MRHQEWTAGCVIEGLRRQSLVGGLVIVLLLVGVLTTAVGMATELASFRHKLPDNPNLLRIGELIRSGYIYPDSDRPPYLVTIYGPLFYVLLTIPYRLAQAAGIAPQVLVRVCIVGALCLCVLLIFLISRRLDSSRQVAWLCALFPVSALPLWGGGQWMSIRPDFLGLALSLLSVYWFFRSNGRPQAIGAAICCGLALLLKLTLFAAPIAILSWLIYRRRYKEAVLWATGVALTVVGGYAIVWWREPLMLKHLAAFLMHPVVVYGQALGFLMQAFSHPVVPFALIGGFLALRNRTPERVLFLIYCVVAWLVAIVTIPQVGGGINYFWEPILASAVLAGPGLCELQRKAHRTPILVTAMLFVLLLEWFVPILWSELYYLRDSYMTAREYQTRKAKWESFVAGVSGRKLLSPISAVAILSITPEIPDPFLNAVLELRGQWNSGPVAAQIDAGVYELIVIGKGATQARGGYRGVRAWSDGMWEALKRSYRLACVFEDILEEDLEVWLPRRGSAEILPHLTAIGCRSPAVDSQTQ